MSCIWCVDHAVPHLVFSALNCSPCYRWLFEWIVFMSFFLQSSLNEPRHSWLWKNFFAMLWLTMERWLSVGAWRFAAGWGGECKMCNLVGVEWNEHALCSCLMVTEAWRQYTFLRTQFNPRHNNNTWNKILYGEITSVLGAPTTEEATNWNWEGKIMTTENTAWNILIACIVWIIYVQKCAQESNGKAFNLGKVLFYA